MVLENLSSGLEILSYKDLLCMVLFIYLMYLCKIFIINTNHHSKSALPEPIVLNLCEMYVHDRLHKPSEVNTIIIHIFQIRKLRLRKVQKCVQLYVCIHLVGGRNRIWASPLDCCSVAQFALQTSVLDGFLILPGRNLVFCSPFLT